MFFLKHKKFHKVIYLAVQIFMQKNYPLMHNGGG